MRPHHIIDEEIDNCEKLIKRLEEYTPKGEYGTEEHFKEFEQMQQNYNTIHGLRVRVITLRWVLNEY